MIFSIKISQGTLQFLTHGCEVDQRILVTTSSQVLPMANPEVWRDGHLINHTLCDWRGI